MMNSANESTMMEAINLLTHYGFEIAGYTVEELSEKWLNQYQSMWIRLAVVEALYQGRYKAISVEQILNFWQKKGNPIYHFTKDFERLICKNITQEQETNIQEQPTDFESINLTQVENLVKDLDPDQQDNSSALAIIYYPAQNQPIHQFMPPADSSQFFLRLKEFIDQEVE